MSHDSVPRRRFLRGLGATAILGAAAGCSALPLDGDEPGATIPADALWAVVEDEPPTVPETLPVDIETSYLDSAADEARETLATAPAPFTASEIPNGAIRQELDHVHDHAVSFLEGADAAASPFDALQSLRRARGEASELSAAWGAIDRGLTREEVAERARPIEADLADFVGRREYVGGDRVRAAVVQSIVERTVRSAGRNADVDDEALEMEPENPVTVGELAGELGRARAAVDDVSYLYDRYVGSIDGPADLRPALESAAASLVEDVEARRREIPSVDPSKPSALVERDVGGTTAEVLESLYWRVESPDEAARARDAGRPATAVVRAHASLAGFRAFSSVREQVTDGASFEVETAADVGVLRSDAADALESARRSRRGATLANRELASLADRLRDADRRLVPDGESVPVDVIAYEVSEYVVVAALARALPPASEQVAGVLRSVRG